MTPLRAAVIAGLLAIAGGAAWLWSRPSAQSTPPHHDVAAAAGEAAPAPGARALLEGLVVQVDRADGAAAAPRTAAAPDDARAAAGSEEALVDADGRPTRLLVRAAIEQALSDRLRSHKLSEPDVERLVDAVVRLREAREALRALPESADAAAVRRALNDEVERAGGDFARVMGMGLDAFTAEAEPHGGVDTFSPDEPVPEPEYLEPQP